MRRAQIPQAIRAHLRVAHVQPTQVEALGHATDKAVSDRRPAQAQGRDVAHRLEQRREPGLAHAWKFERQVFRLLAQAWFAQEASARQADRAFPRQVCG